MRGEGKRITHEIQITTHPECLCMRVCLYFRHIIGDSPSNQHFAVYLEATLVQCFSLVSNMNQLWSRRRGNKHRFFSLLFVFLYCKDSNQTHPGLTSSTSTKPPGTSWEPLSRTSAVRLATQARLSSFWRHMRRYPCTGRYHTSRCSRLERSAITSTSSILLRSATPQ